MLVATGTTPARAAVYGPQQTLIGAALNNPTGVATDAAGDLFVADTNNDRIMELPHGSTNWAEVPFTDIAEPSSVAVDAAGDVFVTSDWDSRVVELVHGSNTQVDLPFSGFPIGGLAANGAGDVFVTDAGSSRVLELVHGSDTPTVLPFGDWYLQDPMGVTVDGSGDVFVADMGNDRVVKLADGSSTPTVLPFGDLSEPTAVAVDGVGNVFATPYGGCQVVELVHTTNTQVTLPFDGTIEVRGVAADGSGNVFVSDISANATRAAADPGPTRRISEVGGRIMELAHGSDTPTVLPVSGLRTPYGVAANTAGDLVVADTDNARVIERRHGSSTWTRLPFTGLNAPTGAAIDEAGNVYVVDGTRVLELPRGSSSQKLLPFSGLRHPNCVAVDGAGNVFVADGGNDRVVELTHGSWTQATLPFTGLYEPQGVAVDAAGDVFVSDWGHSRVLELPGGSPPQLQIGPLNGVLGWALAVDASGDLIVADKLGGDVLELDLWSSSATAVPFDIVFPYGVTVDGSGNVYAIDGYWSRLVEVPNTAGPPPITTIVSGPSGTVRSTLARFAFSSTQGGSTYHCALDAGAWKACTSPRTYTGLGQGPHTFRVVATNHAHETDPTPTSRSWKVDTIRPQTTITHHPAATVHLSTAVFSFMSSQRGSTFLCSVDRKPLATCTSPKRYQGLRAGRHVFVVRAEDPAGNVDPTPAAWHWKVA